ncbi:TonB-dependent receptor plug domain-containing protein [Sphingopyxis sp.]|jgi:outer membrane receptor protein involved in Fe transport|uniref:TonB-dependent receptor plug domain-containing protein n=1 Tax=Sphingopyxis sp. TaxID=1908224 RepID=UPI002E13F534
MIAVPLSVHAQEADQAAEAPEDAAGAGDIIVTGSRTINDGTRAPTPVTVIGSHQLKQASPGPIGEALQQLPVFRGSTNSTTGTVSSNEPRAGNFLNLRNLGPQRTLLLVDGRRIAPSSVIGATDTNLIPQDLVKRVDVVTGGASAAYGSDAVSGVVNFILDTRFEGLRGEVVGGISNYGDGRTFKASVTAGTGFGDGRGRIVVSGTYNNVQPISNVSSRPWGRERRGTVNDPANPALLIITTDVHSPNMSAGGVITSPGPLRGIQFGPDGTTAPYSFGTNVGAFTATGGDGAFFETNIRALVDSKALFGRVGYDVTDSLEVYVQGGYGSVHNRYAQVQPFNLAVYNPITIFSGNPFLPEAVQDVMTAQAIPTFTMGRLFSDLDPVTADASSRSWDVTAGISGELGGGWSVDAYYGHGQTRQRIRTENNPVMENIYAAFDAVEGPDGTPVCRVTLTNPELYPGCVPLNPFGSGSPSDAAVDYAFGTAQYVTRVKQDVAAVSLRGEPFSTWAGPVAFSIGGEWRKLSVRQVSDPISQRLNAGIGIRGFPSRFTTAPGGFLMTNAQPVAGSYNVKEAFAEALVPLARDVGFARMLELNGAVRYTDYSTSGGVATWKLGLVYEPVDGLRFRGSRSRDIRAPNIAELYSGAVQGINNVTDPQRGNAQFSARVSTLGNTDLKPEKADTWTIGAVASPSFLPGFSLSADYFDIDLKGMIASFTAQQTVDQCAQGTTVACSNISRDETGAIILIRAPQLNLGRSRTRGMDFELNYRTSIGADRLAFRGIVSHLMKSATQVAGGTPLVRTGEVGLSASPRWTATANLQFSTEGGTSLFLQERYIGPGKYDASRIEGVTIADNRIGAVWYTDATISQKIDFNGHQFEWGVTVNNLFNQSPPNAPTGTLGAFSPSNPNLYDIVGRYFSTSVRVNF